MTTANSLAALVNSSSQVVVPSGGIAFTDLDSSNDSTTANEAYVMGQDGYETGTWTPKLNGTQTSTVYGTRNGTYVKVGELVYVAGELPITTRGVASTLVIAGLPFADNGQEGTISVNRILNSAVNVNNIDGGTGGDLIFFKGNTSAGTSYVNMSIFQDGTHIWFSGTYRTS